MFIHGVLEVLFIALPALLLWRLAKNFFYEHLWIEPSRPAGNNASDKRVGLAANAGRHLVAGDPTQGGDVFAEYAYHFIRIVESGSRASVAYGPFNAHPVLT